MDHLEDLGYRLPSLILRQSVQSLNHRLHFLLTNKLPNKFFFHSFISQVLNSLTDDGLTKLSLFRLFGRRRECGEQLDEDLDDHLIHGFCGRDLGIDLKATEEVAN